MNGFWDRRRVALAIGVSVLASVAAVALIGEAAHFPQLLKRLRGATPGWLVVCAAGQALAYAGYIAGYQAMAGLRGGPELPVLTATRVVGLSFGAFSFATTIGGLSVDLWALHEAGEPGERAGARVIALETLRWAVLGVAVCTAAVVLLAHGSRRPPWGVSVAWLAVVALCFAGAIWISAKGRRERFLGGTRGRIRKALAVAVRAIVYLRELLRARPSLQVRAIGGMALYWTGDLLCAWAALRAFGTELALLPLLLGYTTGYLAEALPLPAGGSGGVEAAMTGGFALAGAPLTGALLGAVAFRVFNFWLPALPAAASVLTVRDLRERLRRIALERRA